jgi:PKD repeat protein
MARSNSTIRGAGGTPPGMVDVLSPARSGSPDVVATRNSEAVAHKMMRAQAAKDNLVPDKNVDRTLMSPDFTVDVDTGAAPLDVQFSYSGGLGADEYLWDFGDGGMSTDRDPAYTYAAAGVYDVSLTVKRTGTYGEVTQDNETVTKAGFITAT